jgi:hypothetical protein
MNNKVSVFVVGAPKAGTTTLFQILLQSKDVVLPLAKEPNYFSSDFHMRWENFNKTDAKNIKRFPKKYKPGLFHSAKTDNIEDYKKMFFPTGKDQTLIDFSTTYLSSITAPKMIYDYNPKAKIIIIIRDPLSRAWSHYNMDKAIGYHQKPFTECLEEEEDAIKHDRDYPYSYIRDSDYQKSVKRYQDNFEESQILLVNFSSFIKNQDFEIRNICKFIEIKYFSYSLNTDLNSSRKFRFEKLRWLSIIIKLFVNKLPIPKKIKSIVKKIIFKRVKLPKPDDQYIKGFFKSCNIT